MKNNLRTFSRFPLHHSSILLLSCVTLSASAWAGITEFENGPADFTENFSISGSENSTRFFRSIGVMGGGGLRVFNTQNMIYIGEGDQIPKLRVGASVTMSAFVMRSDENIPGSGARIFAMGLTTDDTPVDNLGTGGVGTSIPGQGNFGFTIKSDGTTTDGMTKMRIHTFDSANGNEAVMSPSFGTFELPDAVWLKVEISFTKTANSGVWQGTIKVDNYGVSGDALVENLVEAAEQPFDGDGAIQAYNDETVYATLGAHAKLSSMIDNFALETSQ